MLLTTFPIISTEHLVLRNHKQDDKEDYYEYVKNIKNDILKLISYEICKELNNLKPK